MSLDSEGNREKDDPVQIRERGGKSQCQGQDTECVII